MINHSISENVLLFEILTVDGLKPHLPCSVLKQDHPYDCTKCASPYVTEGRRKDPKTCNRWALSFLKQCKRNIRLLHSYWGTRHPKFAITPRRTGSGLIKKKIRSPVRNRFVVKISHDARETLIIDKENNNDHWAIGKEQAALLQK